MKKLLAITIGLVMSVSLIGCQSTNNETQQTKEVKSQSNSTENTETSNSETVVIEHSKGTTEVPKNPTKIAVFDFGVLDTLDKLGVDVELALATPSIPSYLSKYENATPVGDLKTPDIEGLFNFEPEIIFISGRQADYYDELNKIAPTVYVDLNSKTYLEDFTKNVTYLAEIFGKEEEAKAELEKINAKIEEVKQKANATDEKALVIMLKENKISAFGSGSRFGMIHDTLQVKQADENIPQSTHGNEVSFEYISEINPDILYVVDRNTVVDGDGSNVSILDNELVKQTTASKTDKIVNLDAEVWYIAGGGLSSVYKMIEEVENGLN